MQGVRRLFSGSKNPPADTVEPFDVAAVAFAHVPPRIPPKFAVPAMPHPRPYERIAIFSSPEGLLLRPEVSNAESHVLVRWGKTPSVESIDGDVGAPSEDAVIVYGIVGILRLFTTAYLLVVDVRETSGQLLDGDHIIYGIKHITAIPLEEGRVASALSAIKTCNATTRATESTLPSESSATIPDDALEIPIVEEPLLNDKKHVSASEDDRKSAHVRFVSQVEVREPNGQRLMVHRPPSPLPSSSSSTQSSGRSSPTSPVGSALAARMSFWDRIYKRGSSTTTNAPNQVRQNLESSIPIPESFDKLLKMQYEDEGVEPQDAIATIAAAVTSVSPPPADEQNRELESKIVRETIRLFSKGGMYFAYDFDITTPLQRKREAIARARRQASLLNELDVGSPAEEEEIDVLCEPQATLPLWRRVDKRFWWNSSMVQAFVEAGLHPYVLPIMQGYFQMSSFSVPIPDGEDPLYGPGEELSSNNVRTTDDFPKTIIEQNSPEDVPEHRGEVASQVAADVAEAITEPLANVPTKEPDLSLQTITVDYIIVSRRSRDRAGLRYQRRGIDDDANVANFVETETIMRIRRNGIDNVFSYLQIRGSIPLFWTQPGYSLKPAPQLSSDRTHAQNLDVLKRHFDRTIKAYGPHTIVNLAEQHGKEAQVTKAYGDFVGEMGSDNVRYVEYDFHAETKGMKYENIQQLITQLERAFESQGFLWVSNKIGLSEQKGVFRVNCIDCLDRTNVVQSAFARFVLHRQLRALALQTAGEAGKTEADVVFNDVWANNGDAISQEYAGTSALKGDFTRTGKRDITGMLHDGVNSLARVYSSSFSDWFSQAVIDYMTGSRSISVFTEFLRDLASKDPRELLRISKVREAAIETCTSRVLHEGERLLFGWTLFSPLDLNTRISDRFEEKVVLLTAKALYVASYDYNLEKVNMFTRIPLGDIVEIRKGPYIVSVLDESSRDPVQNYGFMIAYLPTRQDTRVSTYTMRNSVDSAAISPPTSPVVTNFSKKGMRRPTFMGQGAHVLSRVLTNVSLSASNDDVVSIAFKALPVDSSKERRGSTLAGAPVKEPLTCVDAINNIVESLQAACKDIGAVHSEFIIEKDIVSLAEAQSSTSVYAKLEYGVKRLLWLGR